MIESELIYCFFKEMFITEKEYSNCVYCVNKKHMNCITTMNFENNKYYSGIEQVRLNLRKKKLDSL